MTLLDAEADTSNEQAVILEPGVGETPLWDTLVLSALFPADSNALLLLAALESFDPELDWSSGSFRAVEDGAGNVHGSTSSSRWTSAAVPGSCRGTMNCPMPHRPPMPPWCGWTLARRSVRAPTPTTALCLRWLDQLAVDGLLQGQRVLDFGCGSGILALAALSWAPPKPSAWTTIRRPWSPPPTMPSATASRPACMCTCRRGPEPVATYPIVVANILASALDALAELLAARVAAGGRIALSGILHGQEGELLQRYAAWFDDLQATQDGDWMRITGVRRA